MSKHKLFSVFTILAISITSLIFLPSCKDSPVSTSPSASVSMYAENTESSSGVLTVESAKFIIEKVQIHSSSNSPTIKTGPFRVFVNLSNRVTTWGIANVPTGTYDRVSFKIHKHNPGEPLPDNDPDFLNPSGQVGYSGVIRGTYNGEPFVYNSSVTAYQSLVIEPVLIIPENVDAAFNTTIIVLWKQWFVRNGEVLDPRVEENWNDIERSIKESFMRAFRDNDNNGIPD